MNLNPLYHLRRYHEQHKQIAALETQNNTLLARNAELANEKQKLLAQLDECHGQDLKPIITKRSYQHKKRGRK